MPAVRRVFPTSYAFPEDCFSILFVAEGFTAQGQGTFSAAVSDFVEQLVAFTPFNVTRLNPAWLAVYALDVTSVSEGPAFGAVPANTSLKSTYDPITRSLSIDAFALETAVRSVTVPGEEGDGDSSGDSVWNRFASSLVVVLLPASTAQGNVSGEMAFNPDFPPIPGNGDIPFVATSIDGDWYRIVLHRIATILGLWSEYELPGPNFREPDSVVAYGLYTFAPNLVVFRSGNTSTSLPRSASPELPDQNFKWLPLLTSSQRSQPLSIHAHPGAVDSANYSLQSPANKNIALYEGGGGYRTKVYRAGADCLMRRHIGDYSIPIKSSPTGFCSVCEHFIRNRIDGHKVSPARRGRLHSQTLRHDDVAWNNVDKSTAVPMPRRSVSGGLSSLSAGEPYWEFAYDVDATLGLRVFDAKFVHGGGSDDFAAVIQFLDITATFEDGSSAAFRISDAIASGKASLEIADSGQIGTDKRYQYGLKLTLEHSVGGFAPVRAEMSVVFRGKNNDFDPGGVVEAAKVYPQLALTWASGAKKKVKSLSGRVLVVINNHGRASGDHGHENSHQARVDENVINLFTDSNNSLKDGRLYQQPVRAFTPYGGIPIVGIGNFNTEPFPNWHLAFDYARVSLTNEIEFTGVAGSGDAWAAARGPVSYAWPTGSTHALKPRKVARQGAYDSIHCHAWMDEDHNTPGKPLVHAPGCGEACFHFHWRWGPLAVSAIAPHLDASLFKGWSADAGSSRAGSVAAAPLIPPNQHARITIAEESTPGNAAGPSIVGPSKVHVGNKALHKLRRAIWYSVEARDLLRRSGERQVILEQGLGIAFDYAVTGASTKLQEAIVDCWNDVFFSMVTRVVDPKVVWPTGPRPGVPSSKPFWKDKYPSGLSSPMDKFHALYQWIRWFNHLNPGGTPPQQIPDGDYKGAAAQPVEEL